MSNQPDGGSDGKCLKIKINYMHTHTYILLSWLPNTGFPCIPTPKLTLALSLLLQHQLLVPLVVAGTTLAGVGQGQ